MAATPSELTVQPSRRAAEKRKAESVEGEAAAAAAMATARKAPRMVAIWAVVVVVVAADLFGAAVARSASARHAVGKKQREFDYFALALQWPGTICASTRHCCAINGCCR